MNNPIVKRLMAYYEAANNHEAQACMKEAAKAITELEKELEGYKTGLHKMREEARLIYAKLGEAEARKLRPSAEFHEMLSLWVAEHPQLAANTLIKHCGVELLVTGNDYASPPSKK